jgi:hypothetical protein
MKFNFKVGLLCALCVLLRLNLPAATLPLFEFPATNRVAGSNLIPIGVHPGVDGLKSIRADDFFSDFTGNFQLAATLWVSSAGNDAIALRGRIDRPFATPTAAKAAATNGDTISVLPGTYHNSSNLLKAGVNWFGWPGATLTFTNTTNNGPGWGIFDDRWSGAVTSVVSGAFDLLWCSGLPGTNALGGACCYPTNVLAAVVNTNPATKLSMQCESIKYISLGTSHAAIWSINGNGAFFRAREILDLFNATNFFVGLDDISDPVYEQSQGIGFYWESGETYLNSGVVSGRQYSFYAKANADAHSNLWITCDHAIGLYYIDGTSAPADWRTWADIKELETQTNSAGGNTWTVLGGGKHYLTVLKIHSPIVTAVNILGGETWLNCQKISSATRFINLIGGTLHATIMDWEDLGVVEGILVKSGGNLQLKAGGRMVVLNGVGLDYDIGATGRVANFTIDTKTTSSTNNPCVLLKTNGLILANCVLVSSATANGIMATSAKSIRLHGHNMSNKPTFATNTQVSVLSGTLEGDADVD